MLKIYARNGTAQKAVLSVPEGFEKHALIKLNESLEGDWLPVDNIKPGELLTFEDEMIYTGYAPGVKRYTNNIKKLK